MSTHSGFPAPSGLPEEIASHRLLTSDEAAVVLGVPVATLRTWRSRRRGYGPRAVQVGGSIRYRPADLLAWIDEHTENEDGSVSEGIEGSKRGKTSPADLPPVTRHRRPSRKPLAGGAGIHGSATAH
ncbi:helix-turn-helix domain-containing protein [Nocardioides sp.]|uniref:Excisionase/Xis, DNA-binding protein (Modular protein) n=1 Tax=metagenome TaxID=256318 RepID=A0A2P2BX09_9ZZZZ